MSEPVLYLDPPPVSERPALCASHGHPGHCFNPRADRTWCLCGEVTYSGDRVDWELTRNDGPLSMWRRP